MKRVLIYSCLIGVVASSSLAAEVCGHITSYCMNGLCARFVCNEAESYELAGMSELATNEIINYVGQVACVDGILDRDGKTFHVESVRQSP